MFDAERRKEWANRADFAHTYSSLILMLAGISRGALPFISDESIKASESFDKFHSAAVVIVFIAAAIMIRTNTFGHFAKRVQSLNEVNNVNKENPQNTYRRI